MYILGSGCLRRFDFSRKTGEAGGLEAREAGDEHARDHGKEEGERRNVSHPFPFPFLPYAPTTFTARQNLFPLPFSLARPPLSWQERRLGTRQLQLPFWLVVNELFLLLCLRLVAAPAVFSARFRRLVLPAGMLGLGPGPFLSRYRCLELSSPLARQCS